jgi:chemotaxis protein MotB
LQLRALVPQLLGKPHKIQVRGHTARVLRAKAGVPFDEWQICYDRCLVVMKFLVDFGIEPERIRLSQDGSYEPFSERDEALFRDMNSRVEVFAISEFARGFKDTIEERAGKFVEAKTVVPPPAEGHDAKEPAAAGHGAAKEAPADKKAGGHGADKASAKDSAHGAKAEGAKKSGGH